MIRDGSEAQLSAYFLIGMIGVIFTGGLVWAVVRAIKFVVAMVRVQVSSLSSAPTLPSSPSAPQSPADCTQSTSLPETG